MDVRMPDGTIITGVPEGITQTELLARYSKIQASSPPMGNVSPESVQDPFIQEAEAQGLPGLRPAAQAQRPAAQPQKPSELAMGEELSKGAASGVIGLKSMWENAGVMKDVGAMATVQGRLSLFDKIDSGEITDNDQLRGLDSNTSVARSYLASDPAMREKLRDRMVGEIGNRKDFVNASIETINRYQKDAQKYRGRTTDLTDIEGAKDFANWLSFNVGSGAVQMVPIMLAAVTTGPAGVAALGTTMGVSEAVGNRLDAIMPKLEGMPPEQKAEAVIDYVKKTGDTNLAVGIVSGAFDALLGPAAALAKRGLGPVVKGETRMQALKAGIKETPKQMGEEFIAGGAQEFTQQAGAYKEGEIDALMTRETAKKVLNAAAAEAAGSLGGSGITTAARVYGAKGPEPEKAPPAAGLEALLPSLVGTPQTPGKPAPTLDEQIKELMATAGVATETPTAPVEEAAAPTGIAPAAEQDQASIDRDAMLAELEAAMSGTTPEVQQVAPTTIEEIIDGPEATEAEQAEAQGQEPAAAAEPVIPKGSAKRVTDVEDGTVDTWYDSGSRSWVTQRLDAEGNQIGDANYDGTQEDAKRSHADMVSDSKPVARTKEQVDAELKKLILESVKDKKPNPDRDAKIDSLMAEKKAFEPAPPMSGLAVKEKELRGNDVISEAKDFANNGEEAFFNTDTNELFTKYPDGMGIKHYAGNRSTDGVVDLKPVTTPDDVRKAISEGKMFVSIGEGSDAVKAVSTNADLAKQLDDMGRQFKLGKYSPQPTAQKAVEAMDKIKSKRVVDPASVGWMKGQGIVTQEPGKKPQFTRMGDRFAKNLADAYGKLTEEQKVNRSEDDRIIRESLEKAKAATEKERTKAVAERAKKEAKPSGPTPEAAEMEKLKQEMQDALGDLSMILTKGTRLNMVPEDEQKLMPVLTKVMDLAFRMGYIKFKEAAKYVMDLIRSKMGDEAADSISLDHLQGAYIGMAGKYQDKGASTKKEVIAVESLDELNEESTEEAEGAPADGNQAIIEGIRDHLLNGGSFSTIIEARKFIEGITGNKIEAGTQQAKEADEMIEAGVVMSARQIIADGREDGLKSQTIYEQLVDLYDRQPSLNVRSSTSVANQAYSTPAPLAFVASELAGINSKTSVYEPTGGNGMLLIGANPDLITVNELDPRRFEVLRNMFSGSDAEVTQGDALEVSTKGKSFNVVIENPPFGKVGDISNIDHEIAMHSLRMLDDDGRGVLILGGVQATTEEGRQDGYRGKAKREFYYELYNKYNVVDHFTVGGNMYSKQGTTYPVDVIVIDGIGKSKRDLPAADLPQLITSYEQLKEKLNDRLVPGQDSSASGADGGVGETGRGESGAVDSGTVEQGVGSGTEGRGPTGGGEPGVSDAGPATGGQSQPAGGRTGAAQPGSTDESKRGGQQPVSGDGVTKAGSKTGTQGSGSTNLGGVSVVSGERVGSGLTDRAGQEQETAGQVAYVPHSQANAVGTLVPRAMADAIEQSLDRIEEAVGDIDTYVAESLEMDVETMRELFSAEQIDALALSIRNAEAGKGFIIGDQTGVGKGRVVAAMIRYALINDKIPIFVTEKPNLYSDMIRDLDDIGMTDELGLDTAKPKILITNSSEAIPYTLLRTVDGELTENNLTLKAPKSGAALDGVLKRMQETESLGDYKVIFTTYSQMQTVKGKPTERMRFIQQFGAGNYMIFDESHNAGGAGETQARTKEQREKAKEGESLTTGRASFVRQLVQNAFGTFFSSATYAKRPDVMDLYSSTDMRLAVERMSDLADAIKNGGIPMQQTVANMLTQAGQYIRRERTFAGVSYDTQETKVDRGTAENMATSMRDILAFSRAKDEVVKRIQKDLDKQGAKAGGVEGEKTQVAGANFGSIMHNLIDQMLLSLKAQDSVRHAIERLKAGEKVVMTVSNTMGSFLQSYADDMGLVTGDPVDLSFKDLYMRYLEKQRMITIKRPGGRREEYRLTDEDLGEALVNRYKEISNFIENAGFGSAPISPIDYLHAELRKAGYKTEEITGRTVVLNYENATVNQGRSETVFSFETEESGLDKSDRYTTYAKAKPTDDRLSTSFEIGTVVVNSVSKDRMVVVGAPKRSEDDNIYIAVKSLKTGKVSLTVVPFVDRTNEKSDVDKDYQAELDSYKFARAGTGKSSPVLTSRQANIKQRVNAVKAFNSGDADVIILNQAGSTGLSLHASSKVKDKRKRHMIIVQPEKNIDTHMQMLGRVHRTGQVIPPAYSQMMADIPAEMRPAAVLLKKMASLSANTTASRKSAVSAEGAVDFMNDYGGQVAQEFLRDNMEVLEALGGNRILSLKEDSTEAEEADIRRLTGYIPILPIKQQEEIYKDLIERYKDLIEREDSMGSNKLESKAVDLDAKTVESKQITEDKQNESNSTSVFAKPAVMERVDVKRTVKPYSKNEVMEQSEENLKGKSAYDAGNEMLRALNDRVNEFRRVQLEAMQSVPEPDPVKIENLKTQLLTQYNHAKAIVQNYPIGTPVSIKNTNGVFIYGVVTNIESKGKTKNPAAGSDMKMTLALANGDAKSITLTFSQIGSSYTLKQEDEVQYLNPETLKMERIPLIEMFDKGATVRREKRWMVTGNILAGYAAVNNMGQIMTYTKDDGTTAQGVLMPRTFDFEKQQKNAPVKLKSVDQVMQFFEKFGPKSVIGTEGATFRISYRGGTQYQFATSSSKREGGTFFLDTDLTKITGDFYKSGSIMSTTVYGTDNFERAIQYLLRDRGETLVALTNKDEARAAFQVPLSNIEPDYNQQLLNPIMAAEGDREELIRKFQSARQQRAAIVRKFMTGAAGLKEQAKLTELTEVADSLKAAIQETKEERRSPKNFFADATAQWDQGNISDAVYSVIKDVYEKFPFVLESLKLSVRKGERNAAGQYSPLNRFVYLYKGTSGVENPSTIRHEMMHSLEQMMSEDATADLIEAWRKSLVKKMESDKSPKAQRFFDKLMAFYDKPTQESYQLALEALPSYDYYQYMNPSEFWAVNAEGLMARKLGSGWDRFVLAVKKLYEGAKNIFGFDNTYAVHKAFNEVMSGERKRIGQAALVDYVTSQKVLLENQNTRRNYKGGPAPLASWTSAPESKIDDFVYKIQDKHIDTKRVVEAITEEIGDIADRWDPYLQEELYHGRTADQTKNFLKDELQPLLKDMQKRGVVLEDFETYLHMRNAQAYNELVASRNPQMPDSGSGIETAVAQDYLANLTKEDRKNYEELAAGIDKIVTGTQEILVDTGMEKAETIQGWREKLPNYVPMKRDENELDFVSTGSGMGTGFSSGGSFTKTAAGSYKTVVDIVGNIAIQRQRAIVRSEKARVGRALYGLAITSPNPEFWMPINPAAIKNKKKLVQELKNMGIDPAEAENIIQEPQVPRLNKKTGQIEYVVNVSKRMADNVFSVRINGEDRYIFFNPGDPRAKRMVQALQNLDADQLSGIMGKVAEMTRFYAALNTQYNPVFGAWNFMRDNTAGAINLSGTPIASRKLEVFRNSFTAVRAIYRDLREKGSTTPEMQKWIDLFERFQKAGGQTGYQDTFTRSKEKATIVQRELKNLDAGNARKAANAVFNWLSDYNDAMENAVRLAAFKAALEEGLSEERAASLAKNLTVNFNRKGQSGTFLNGLYAFLNASIQGTARMMKLLVDRTPDGRYKLSKHGKRIIAGGMAIGVFQALALSMAGFGEDEPPEFLKNKNLIIPDFVTGSGNYLIIPMPLGLNVLPNVGRTLTEYAMSDRPDATKLMVKLFVTVIDAFNPLGSSGFAQTMAPTLLDPIVAISENKDAFGRPISRPDRATNPTPGYMRSRESSSAFSQGMAYALNYMTGGGEYGIGAASYTADEIDYLIAQYTGGVGREVSKAVRYVSAKVTGEETPPYKTPILGKLYGETTTPSAVTDKFYKNVTMLAEHEGTIKRMQADRVSTTEYRQENPEVRLISTANNLENQVSKLNRTKKELLAKEQTDSVKARIKRIDEQKARMMTNFNERVKAAQQ